MAIPRCQMCGRMVDEYHVADETRDHVEIEARCGGRSDAMGVILHPPRRGVKRVPKWPGCTLRDMQAAIGQLEFFGPELIEGVTAWKT